MNSIEQTNSKSILKSIFGYDSFRPNQEEVIDAILSGKDVFTSMPTGGGKSLCYQIPGIIFEGLTVVISPLIALMKDQVDEAIEKGISATFLNSSLSRKETVEIYSRLYRGEVKILYISPERLAIDGYIEKLHDFKVKFFAIDEAHCLSEWGHDFRPDYLFLAQLRNNFPSVPIAAFTATATKQVQKDIIRILSLENPFIVRSSFNRKELYYKIENKNELEHEVQILQNALDFSDVKVRECMVPRTEVRALEENVTIETIKNLFIETGLSKILIYRG
ncbi:MAG: RecQ family ATP-dependent DNA helicase, partial [Spirochaetales bacterium]|nr:RecQ family ATP-dependent DNA helicase [Spirochaetales bacterium]